MHFCSRHALLSVLIAGAFAVAAPAWSQLAGSKDLTGIDTTDHAYARREPAAWSKEECYDKPLAFGSLEPGSQHRTLRLEIAGSEMPSPGSFIVTLRIYNESVLTQYIPWQTDPVEPVADERDKSSQIVEEGHLGLEVSGPDERKLVYPKGGLGGATIRLWGQYGPAPGNLAIKPGQRAEIRMKFGLQCKEDDSAACIRLLREGPIHVTASWSQSTMSRSHTAEGCRRGVFEYLDVASPAVDLFAATAQHPPAPVRANGPAAMSRKLMQPEAQSSHVPPGSSIP